MCLWKVLNCLFRWLENTVFSRLNAWRLYNFERFERAFNGHNMNGVDDEFIPYVGFFV